MESLERIDEVFFVLGIQVLLDDHRRLLAVILYLILEEFEQSWLQASLELGQHSQVGVTLRLLHVLCCWL